MQRQAAELVSVISSATPPGIELSTHARQEIADEWLLVRDVIAALQNPEILEVYESDDEDQRCLALLKCRGQAVHAALRVRGDNTLVILTVYIPCPPDWVTARRRGKQR